MREVVARRRKTLLLIGALLLGYGGLKALPRLWPKAPLSAGFPSSLAVRSADGELLRLTLARDERFRLWTPLERISPLLVEAVLRYEDRHFRRHPGVNPVSLARAAWTTYVEGGRRMGGSTITMQLARRLHGLRSSTPAGKLIQIGRALALELFYTKDEILEAYLNLCPLGGNIEGMPAAAWIYFGKPPDRLLLGEALTLAVIPQDPTHRGPRREVWPPELRASRAALLAAWRDSHPETEGDADLARLPIALRPSRALPFAAPHLVERVLGRGPRREAEVATTLDGGLQRLLERQVRAFLARRGPEGLRNAAALLVEHRTMEVRALLGSADFFERQISGQVDGTAARRSPGSTLKPFIYALGLDQGLIHPATLLKDSPSSYAGYRPENFDKSFVGPISAEEALVRSRNIPALAVAERLAQPSLHAFLRAAEIRGLRSEAHYGLALALGGAELSMEELVTLYAMLASGGVHRSLRFERADAGATPPGTGRASGSAPRRLLSAEAAFVTLEMLARGQRPGELAAGVPTVRGGPTVAFKTGTSYGFRDAWTVGLFGPYVLAVWLGNFSGEGNPSLVGPRAAAPLFFEIADAIAAERRLGPGPAWTRPAGVERALVCALSGQLPGPNCRHRRSTWYIPGRSPIERCTIHRQVLVDARTGLESCPPHRGPTRAEVHEFWPSDLLALFQLAGVPRRLPPAPGPSCPLQSLAGRGLAPRITSPVRGVSYMARASERIAFLAATDADAREVYWFVDDGLVGRAPADRPFFWRPRPGRFVVRAVDDAGRSDARPILVEALPAE